MKSVAYKGEQKFYEIIDPIRFMTIVDWEDFNNAFKAKFLQKYIADILTDAMSNECGWKHVDTYIDDNNVARVQVRLEYKEKNAQMNYWQDLMKNLNWIVSDDKFITNFSRMPEGYAFVLSFYVKVKE